MKVIKRQVIKVASLLACTHLQHPIEHDEGFIITFGSEQDRNAFLVAFVRQIHDLKDALQIARSIQVGRGEINFVGYRLED